MTSSGAPRPRETADLITLIQDELYPATSVQAYRRYLVALQHPHTLSEILDPQVIRHEVQRVAVPGEPAEEITFEGSERWIRAQLTFTAAVELAASQAVFLPQNEIRDLTGRTETSGMIGALVTERYVHNKGPLQVGIDRFSPSGGVIDSGGFEVVQFTGDRIVERWFLSDPMLPNLRDQLADNAGLWRPE